MASPSLEVEDTDVFSYDISPFSFKLWLQVAATPVSMMHYMNIPEKDWGAPMRESSARTYNNGSTGDIGIIIHPTVLNESVVEILSLVAHECVHVKEFLYENIKEKTDTDELDAYFVQDFCRKVLVFLESQYPQLWKEKNMNNSDRDKLTKVFGMFEEAERHDSTAQKHAKHAEALRADAIAQLKEMKK